MYKKYNLNSRLRNQVDWIAQKPLIIKEIVIINNRIQKNYLNNQSY